MIPREKYAKGTCTTLKNLKLSAQWFLHIYMSGNMNTTYSATTRVIHQGHELYIFTWHILCLCLLLQSLQAYILLPRIEM